MLGLTHLSNSGIGQIATTNALKQSAPRFLPSECFRRLVMTDLCRSDTLGCEEFPGLDRTRSSCVAASFCTQHQNLVATSPTAGQNSWPRLLGGSQKSFRPDQKERRDTKITRSLRRLRFLHHGAYLLPHKPQRI